MDELQEAKEEKVKKQKSGLHAARDKSKISPYTIMILCWSFSFPSGSFVFLFWMFCALCVSVCGCTAPIGCLSEKSERKRKKSINE